MDYKKALKEKVLAADKDITEAVDNDKIDKWFDNCIDYFLIYNKHHEYVGAEVIITYGGCTITLYTRTSQLIGTWYDNEYIYYIGDNYTCDIDKFIEEYCGIE